jgi:hypothetical protein
VKWIGVGLGALFVGLGLMMLVMVLRTGDSVHIMGPLSLMGAGALAISASRKRKK